MTVHAPQHANLYLHIHRLPPGEGWELSDTLRYAPLLHAAGVDFLDVSSGGTDRRQKLEIYPAYQVQFAEAVKKATAGSGLLVGAVGWIRDGKTVEDVSNSFCSETVSWSYEKLPFCVLECDIKEQLLTKCLVE